MFQSYIQVILSYLKLPYVILNLGIAEQLFTPHISVVYSISSDGEYSTTRQGRAELALGKVSFSHNESEILTWMGA